MDKLAKLRKTATDEYMNAFRGKLDSEKLLQIIEDAFAAGYTKGYCRASGICAAETRDEEMKNKLIHLANETLKIIDRMSYQTPDGTTYEIPKLPPTRVIAPEEWPDIVQSSIAIEELPNEAEIEITNETTLAATKRLGQRTLVLNFASAKNVGGGWLTGSRAQEESLVRSSTLYSSLQRAQNYYKANQACHTALYTDYAILSPDVTFFRNDKGELTQGHMATVLTMPAPNAGAITGNDRDLINDTLRRRMRHIYALTAKERYPQLLLGAWGCGVFRNDPETVARLFMEELRLWRKRIKRVTFAVMDKTAAFESAKPQT